MSFEGQTDSCPVCGLTVKLTKTGKLAAHGPKGNRCPVSGETAPIAVRASREGQAPAFRVSGFSIENRAFYTLTEGYRVVTADGRNLIAGAFVVIVSSNKPKHARAIGKLRGDRTPQEYVMAPDWEALVLRQLGFTPDGRKERKR